MIGKIYQQIKENYVQYMHMLLHGIVQLLQIRPTDGYIYDNWKQQLMGMYENLS